MKNFGIPDYLYGDCFNTEHPDICRVTGCAEAVKLNPETGRWFITMGHPGFNSPANNGAGYHSKDSALKAFRRYGNRH